MIKKRIIKIRKNLKKLEIIQKILFKDRLNNKKLDKKKLDKIKVKNKKKS